MADSTIIAMSLLDVPGAYAGLPDACPGADTPIDDEAAKQRALEEEREKREKARHDQAERVAGAGNVFKERPPFVRVSERKDLATGELVEVESVSCPRLAQYIREHCHYKFVKYPNAKTPVRFWYKNGVYVEVYEDEAMGEINKLIDAWNPDILRQRDVEEVYKTIKRNPGDGRFVDFAAKDAEELVVNFKNGLFYPMTWELKPHTPDIFTTRQLPIDFPRDALDMDAQTFSKLTPTFHKYMYRFCRGVNGDHPDGDKRYLCLLEFMAVILSNIKSSHFKKSLWMYGDGDSGKSQLLGLLKYLLGENAFSTDLEALESRFGTGDVFNKRLVYAPDQKFIKVKELGVFKTLVGAGDAVRMERKGRDPISCQYDGFVWLCMNRLPKFGGDHGKWVYDRMIPFKTPPTIPENERDRQLLNKLIAEAPYIAALILRYLPNVIKRGYKITEPLESERARSEYAFENDPVRQWLAECCIDVRKPKDEAEAEAATAKAWWENKDKLTFSELYKHYKKWCKDFEGGYSKNRNEWKQSLKDIAGNPEMSDEDFFLVRDGRKVLALYCLNAAAQEEYNQNSFMY